MATTNLEKLLIKIAAALNKLDARYFVTGGFAVSVWGRPRATFDIDIVVEIFEPQVKLLKKALNKISSAGYFDESTALRAIKSKGEFNFIDSDSGVKIDFWIVDEKDPFDASRLRRRTAEIISGTKIYFTSPEDLILKKLVWHKQTHSDRDLDDAKSIFKISGEKLDKNYLRKWAKYLKISRNLSKLLRQK